jgi:transcriptional regulator with XRE-family HTH domain
MSQERLGELVGFTQAHISMIENGERELNVKTADKIADALGVTLNELLVESEPTPVIKGCRHMDKDDGCCMHPDNLTPECTINSCPGISDPEGFRPLPQPYGGKQ